MVNGRESEPAKLGNHSIGLGGRLETVQYGGIIRFYVHKVKTALNRMEALDKELTLLESRVANVNKALDEVLEQENEQRVHINRLKDEFRLIKRKISENRASYAQSYEYLEMEIANIEKMFSSFEEWMFASEFNKAADEQKEIREHIAHLNDLVDILPGMYERAKGV